MKKIILGTFASRPGAESLIQYLRKDLHLPDDDVSYMYRDEEGDVYEVSDPLETENLSSEVKAGSLVGGALGMVGGGAMFLGILPVLGPIFNTNPIIELVGMSVSVVGMVTVGALLGAVLGGGVASLFEDDGEEEEETASHAHKDVLVVAHARDEERVGKAFTFHGASIVEIYTPTLT